MPTTIARPTTADELQRATTEWGPCELVRGNLITMIPAGSHHGRIEVRVLLSLGAFVEQNRLGAVFSGDTGFILARDPDTVRAPDVAFVLADRVPPEPSPGYFEGAPDLAIEIYSPDDTVDYMVDKVLQYFAAGTQVAWLLHPTSKTLSVHRPGSGPRVYTAEETLTDEPLLPGFSMPIGELFRW